jgi:hypothetical protein
MAPDLYPYHPFLHHLDIPHLPAVPIHRLGCARLEEPMKKRLRATEMQQDFYFEE